MFSYNIMAGCYMEKLEYFMGKPQSTFKNDLTWLILVTFLIDRFPGDACVYRGK